MANSDFHEKPNDAGTLTKLTIFELYVQEWIPVFVSRPDPPFREIHIFDLFCGPGTDSTGAYGSPLRILQQLRAYQAGALAGWSKVKIVAHFSDASARKIEQLEKTVRTAEWHIPGVTVETVALPFEEALAKNENILRNDRAAKLLIIDQFGVDAVNADVFKRLYSYPRTDFIFFLSTSTLHRFRNHPAIKIKIDIPERSYDVHRVAAEWYQNLVPYGAYLGQSSIKKGSNFYGLLFGTKHLLGAHKFLRVAWGNDQVAGEANFDIERENFTPDQTILPFDELRPKKIQRFEQDLAVALRSGTFKSEADIVRLCIVRGMTTQHAAPVLKRLKAEGVFESTFWTPNVARMNDPRPIKFLAEDVDEHSVPDGISLLLRR